MLNAWLSDHHLVTEHSRGPIEEVFDLCIVDASSFPTFVEELQNRREQERPGHLPILLLTQRTDVWESSPTLWQLVDDVMKMPVAKIELQARIEILLRFRRTSHDLKIRNEDLEAFLQAMSHDLRASVRAVTMFTEALASSQADNMDDLGRSDLERIRASAQEMRELIDSLLNFSRLGRGEVRYEPIDLKTYIESCLRNVEADIRNRQASVQIRGRSRTVQAD